MLFRSVALHNPNSSPRTLMVRIPVPANLTVESVESGRVVGNALVWMVTLPAGGDASYDVRIKTRGPSRTVTFAATANGDGQTKIDEGDMSNDLRIVALSLVVYFDTDKYNLRPDALNTLDSVRGLIKRYGITVAYINGNTDSRASVQYNYWLSGQRCKSVADYLLSNLGLRSIAGSVARSELNPVAPNTTEANMQLNRRVEITFG